MLFRIIKTIHEAKNAGGDPSRYAKRSMRAIIFEMLMGPALTLVLFLVLLFSLAYTTFAGGPYDIARFFFWMLMIIYILVGYSAYRIYRSIATRISQAQNTTHDEPYRGAFRDAEVISSE